MHVEGERLCVGPVDGAPEPDLSVRATLGGLIAQLPFMRRDDAPAVGKLRIEGDADLARRLQRLAERFDPDWQQPFVAAFGDIVGVQIAQLFATTFQTARDAAGALATSTADFVQHETHDVVARDELGAFYDDVDTLRDDVERIAARIERLRMRRRA
ncbi:SCP2 domain-containing protein [Lysobacter lacus]|uniref:SCP2 domain-containing protein n=1 Tax=Cognatilysobacter lacus TaxID=1643323 RepID=A0A5D8Z2X2_9GAMM|nr:SCP2 sterol-binding domain-containing protein [Lysobacter lacus]TZF89338.1 SCP2 domain-containing protein [Lysobacter lacus]